MNAEQLSLVNAMAEAMEKPHIFIKNGYWRVDPMPKPFHKNTSLWNKAHRLVQKLNSINSSIQFLTYNGYKVMK